jgi:hypothetical protein
MPKKKTAQRKLRKTAITSKQNRARYERQKTRVLYDGTGSLIDSLQMRNEPEPVENATMDFDPIEIRGEYLSTTLLRERR